MPALRSLVRVLALLALAAGLLSVVPPAVASTSGPGDGDFPVFVEVENLETAYWVGTPRVGWTLSARPGRWSPAIVNVTFVWISDGRTVGEGDTFVPTRDLIGQTIELEATASLSSNEVGVSVFSRPQVVFEGDAPAPTPVDNVETAYFVGTPKVGWTLSARPGVWTPTGVAVTYEWFIGSRRLAAGATYQPVAADLGGEITLKATGRAEGRRATTVAWTRHASVAKGTLSIGGNPTVTGTAKVGSTLTARARTASPKATTTYQWLRGGKAVAGATRSTYRLVAADKGSRLTVKVSYRAAGYLDTSRTSSATGAVR